MKRIPVKANKKAIYNAWTTRVGIESWLLRKAEYKNSEGRILTDNEQVSIGDTYKWLRHGYGDEEMEKGTVLEANGLDVFRFVFGVEGIVTVRIINAENETIVELIQEEIPTDESSKVRYYLGCSIGWTYHLTNLKSILEGGIDLRNKNNKLKNVINS